jgi:hypothetical protein
MLMPTIRRSLTSSLTLKETFHTCGNNSFLSSDRIVLKDIIWKMNAFPEVSWLAEACCCSSIMIRPAKIDDLWKDGRL